MRLFNEYSSLAAGHQSPSRMSKRRRTTFVMRGSGVRVPLAAPSIFRLLAPFSRESCFPKTLVGKRMGSSGVLKLPSGRSERSGAEVGYAGESPRNLVAHAVTLAMCHLTRRAGREPSTCGPAAERLPATRGDGSYKGLPKAWAKLACLIRRGDDVGLSGRHSSSRAHGSCRRGVPSVEALVWVRRWRSGVVWT